MRSQGGKLLLSVQTGIPRCQSIWMILPGYECVPGLQSHSSDSALQLQTTSDALVAAAQRSAELARVLPYLSLMSQVRV